ncbi:alpha/beta fold hydrolase [Spirosoma knui]
MYLPKSYSATLSTRWPVLLYLHGGSLRGNDLSLIARQGLPYQLEHGFDIPFIVVAPQCPSGEIWTDTEGLKAVLDEVTKTYRVDAHRMYATGHSMGGRGVWYLAYTYPDYFAAIIPIAGLSPIQHWATRLSQLPIWAFHGEVDAIVPVSDSQALVTALEQAGGKAKLTILPKRDHFILDLYEQKELYEWLLTHRKP